MESSWEKEMAEAISLGAIEEDIGITTFLWTSYCKGNHVDIVFSINNGSESTSLSAHKLVLALWSPYFADTFYGKDRTSDVILLEDVNIQAFKTMLGYMYGYHYLPKSLKDICELYKVAVKFEVASLAERTKAIVNQSRPDVSNVFDLIEASDLMNDKTEQRNLTKSRCMKIISGKTSAVLKSYDITEISPSRLRLVLDSPTLSLDCEYDLLKYVYAWGKNRYFVSPEFSSDREALEDFLPDLNFLALTNQQFAEFHKNHPDFLKNHEVISIFMNIAEAASWPMPDWHKERAKQRIYSGTNS